MREPLPDPVDLNARQAASYLGMSVRTFHRLAAQDRFPRVDHSARCVRYPKAGLDLYRASRLRGGPGEAAIIDGRCSPDWTKMLPLVLGGESQ